MNRQRLKTPEYASENTRFKYCGKRELMDFKSFNLHRRIQAGVDSEGYDTPTPIQVKAIGPAADVVAEYQEAVLSGTI